MSSITNRPLPGTPSLFPRDKRNDSSSSSFTGKTVHRSFQKQSSEAERVTEEMYNIKSRSKSNATALPPPQVKRKNSAEEKERIEKEEKQVTDDIVKSLESISQLTAEHMTKKGLGSQYKTETATATTQQHSRKGKKKRRRVTNILTITLTIIIKLLETQPSRTLILQLLQQSARSDRPRRQQPQLQRLRR